MQRIWREEGLGPQRSDGMATNGAVDSDDSVLEALEQNELSGFELDDRPVSLEGMSPRALAQLVGECTSDDEVVALLEYMMSARGNGHSIVSLASVLLRDDQKSESTADLVTLQDSLTAEPYGIRPKGVAIGSDARLSEPGEVGISSMRQSFATEDPLAGGIDESETSETRHPEES